MGLSIISTGPKLTNQSHYLEDSGLKAVRESWKNENRKATFFMCKNRIMALALGREESEEYNDNLHKVSKLLRGANRGLMFTNEGR